MNQTLIIKVLVSFFALSILAAPTIDLTVVIPVLLSIAWSNSKKTDIRFFMISSLLLTSVFLSSTYFILSLLAFELSFLTSSGLKGLREKFFILTPFLIILFLFGLGQQLGESVKESLTVLYLTTRLLFLTFNASEITLKYPIYFVFLIMLSLGGPSLNEQSASLAVALIVSLAFFVGNNSLKLNIRFLISYAFLFNSLGLSPELLTAFLINQFMLSRCGPGLFKKPELYLPLLFLLLYCITFLIRNESLLGSLVVAYIAFSPWFGVLKRLGAGSEKTKPDSGDTYSILLFTFNMVLLCS